MTDSLTATTNIGRTTEMPDKDDDVLSREVAIAAKLEENGVAIKAKSRAVAALDRLVGSMLDWPAAFFEGRAGKKRLKDSIEQQRIALEAAIAERKLAGGADGSDQLLHDAARDRARKLTNAAGVAIEAIEAMKALPPPEAEAPNGPAASEPELDEDWLNSFTRYAEDATSEDLQQIWGRVLAGEVNKPGTFSRFTLRFMADLDRQTAQTCEDVGRFVVADFIPQGERWNSGVPLAQLLDLQQLGLVEGVTGLGGLSKTFAVGPPGHAVIRSRRLTLLVQGKPGSTTQLSAIILTRLGREVFSLLDTGDETSRMVELAGLIDKAGLTKISLGAIGVLQGREIFMPHKVLWETEANGA